VRFKSLILVSAAAALSIAAPANAAANLGFETGDLSAWTLSGNGGNANFFFALTAIEGNRLGYVYGGAEGVYSTLSQTFDLAAGQTITGSVGFQVLDYYNDDAYLSINGIHLFDYSVDLAEAQGPSGWRTFTYTAPTAGSYELKLAARNVIDAGFSSGAVLDNVAISSAVPEPATWAMMLLGFGATGAMLRSDRRRTLALT
jgi:hypothetical protein